MKKVIDVVPHQTFSVSKRAYLGLTVMFHNYVFRRVGKDGTHYVKLTPEMENRARKFGVKLTPVEGEGND